MFSLMASLAVFGSSFVYCGDLSKAMAAIARFIQLSDVKPGIDMDSAAGLTLNENIGNIYLRDVEFTYRTRQGYSRIRKTKFVCNNVCIFILHFAPLHIKYFCLMELLNPF